MFQAPMANQDAALRRWWLPATLLTLSATAALWQAAAYETLAIDDAYITLVYARNLALGHGYVYTPGFEAVEGSTSLLWTSICAALYAVNAEHVQALALAVTLMFVSAAVASTCALAARVDGRRGGWLALLWIAGLVDFFDWNALTLMDLALWTGLIGVATWACAAGFRARWRDALAVGLAGSLLIVTRPEAMLLAPTLVVLAGVMAWSAGRPAVPVLRVFGASLAAIGASLCGLVAWRLAVFGVPLPNTYYVKVPPDRLDSAIAGLKYVLRYHTHEPLASLLLLLALAAAWHVGVGLLRATGGRSSSTRDRVVLTTTVVIVLGHLIPLVSGGDHFSASRFMQPFAPLLIVPALWWLGSLAPAGSRAAALALAALLALNGLVSWWPGNGLGQLQVEHGIAEGALRIGKAFDLHTDPSARPSIGVSFAGAIAYAYEGRIVDLLGLNYPAMAHAQGKREGFHGHAAFQPSIFWEAPPDVVAPEIFDAPVTSVCETIFPFENMIFAGLYDDERFRQAYVSGALSTQQGEVTAFYRRDWLAQHAPVGLRILPWPEDVPVERCNQFAPLPAP